MQAGEPVGELTMKSHRVHRGPLAKVAEVVSP